MGKAGPEPAGRTFQDRSLISGAAFQRPEVSNRLILGELHINSWVLPDVPGSGLFYKRAPP